MKNNIMVTLSKGLNKVQFEVKKHAPELLMIGGFVSGGVAVVAACKATLKVTDILESAKETIDVIHETAKIEDIEAKDGTIMHYSKEDETKDLIKVYATTGLELAKVYGPSIAMGTISAACFLASNNILRTRYAASVAAYTAVEKGFREYRGRVIERFGESVDKELKYNLKAAKLEEVVTDENGKEKKVKTNVEVAEESEYARYFTKTNPNWNPVMEYNEMFLRAQQQYANDLLVARGSFTLNDAYDLVGLPRTKAGMVVGWVYDKHNGEGDNFITFNAHKVYLRNEYGDLEPAYALDFNVDGEIYSRI